MNNIFSVNEVNGVYEIPEDIGYNFRFDLSALYFCVEISIFKELKDKKGCIFMVEVINDLDDVRMSKFGKAFYFPFCFLFHEYFQNKELFITLSTC